jgi:hypothetical protein
VSGTVGTGWEGVKRRDGGGGPGADAGAAQRPIGKAGGVLRELNFSPRGGARTDGRRRQTRRGSHSGAGVAEP